MPTGPGYGSFVDKLLDVVIIVTVCLAIAILLTAGILEIASQIESIMGIPIGHSK